MTKKEAEGIYEKEWHSQDGGDDIFCSNGARHGQRGEHG